MAFNIYMLSLWGANEPFLAIKYLNTGVLCNPQDSWIYVQEMWGSSLLAHIFSGSNLSFSWIFGCTFVLYQHNTFVINFINYTYSKLVEIWPMSLAPTNEDSERWNMEENLNG